MENAKTASTVNPEVEAGSKIEAGGLTQLLIKAGGKLLFQDLQYTQTTPH